MQFSQKCYDIQCTIWKKACQTYNSFVSSFVYTLKYYAILNRHFINTYLTNINVNDLFITCMYVSLPRDHRKYTVRFYGLEINPPAALAWLCIIDFHTFQSTNLDYVIMSLLYKTGKLQNNTYITGIIEFR